jgi:hypothetical protein
MSNEPKRYVIVTTKDDGRPEDTIVINGAATIEQAFEAARKRSIYMRAPSAIRIHTDRSQEPAWWEKGSILDEAHEAEPETQS